MRGCNIKHRRKIDELDQDLMLYCLYTTLVKDLREVSDSRRVIIGDMELLMIALDYLVLLVCLPEKGLTTAKDKGKGIIQEPERPMKKKHQVQSNEELARRLQAEEEEEPRTRNGMSIQVKVETDYDFAKKMQEQERQNVPEQEREELWVELLRKRNRMLAEQKAEAKRKKTNDSSSTEENSAPYLKNMAGWIPFTEKELQQEFIFQRGLKVDEVMKRGEVKCKAKDDDSSRRRFSSTQPTEDIDRMLYTELKRIFEPYPKDEV
ncbi:hypothetical protein Tco_0067537 [Tanacetum coccineum]